VQSQANHAPAIIIEAAAAPCIPRLPAEPSEDLASHLSPLCPPARSLPLLLRWSGAVQGPAASAKTDCPSLSAALPRHCIGLASPARQLDCDSTRSCTSCKGAARPLHPRHRFPRPTASIIIITYPWCCCPACSLRCSSIRPRHRNLLRRKRNSSTAPLTIAALSPRQLCNRRLDHQPIIAR